MQTPNQQPRRSAGKNNRSLFRRTVFLMVCLGVLTFVPLVMQLWKLQVKQHDYWESRAADNQKLDVSVNSGRGTIYDSEGRTLAVSATVYQLILSPNDVLNLVDKNEYDTDEEYEAALYVKQKQIVDGLHALFEDMSEEWLWKNIEYTASQYQVLATALEDEEAEAVRQLISVCKLSNSLYLVPASKRYYPYSSIASHVLGFMAQNESSGGVKVGAQGLEAAYQNWLAGKMGRVVTAKNGVGSQMLSSYEAYLDAEDGYDLTLTIDADIQSMLEQTLREGIETYDVQNGAFGIVMNPQTGAVLAMASTPDFDPNNYAAVLDADLKAELEDVAEKYGTDSDEYSAALSTARGEQWKNRTLSDAYEPGSVFKPLTVAMGLEEGIISTSDHFYCGGSKVVVPGTNPIGCWRSAGHGDQDLTKAVMNSCNVALMEIGARIGADVMWEYFENFGLNDYTGIELYEGESQLWDEDLFKGPYGALSVATASFGQGLAVTPIQMIRAFSAVINGGHLLTPYLVQSATDSDGNTVYYHEVEEVRQVISESTSETMREILEAVVGGGGSGRNAYMAGYRIGGKTGTSETFDENGQRSQDVICSFMGFAPVDDPQVIVLLAYDTPERAGGSNYTVSGTYISGGNIAAPMAGELIASILDYLGVEKQYTSDELASTDTTMIRTTGYELTVAKGLLLDRGLNCRTVGNGNIVVDQIPKAGVSIPGGSTVILYLDDTAPTDQVEVPDLTGLTPTAVKNKLEELGLFLRATGVVDYTDSTVTATGQSIEQGTMVSPGTVIEVRFVSNVLDYIAGVTG